MSDLNWCPVCDRAIHSCSQSLYCSLECLQYDAIQKNPLLGYSFTEFKHFLPCPAGRRRFNHHRDQENDSEAFNDDRNRRQQSSLESIPTTSSSSSSSSSSNRSIRTSDSLFPILTLPEHSTKYSLSSPKTERSINGAETCYTPPLHVPFSVIN
ncbi:hypothetical protein BX666DRAFT_459897 [Dichotomocladium elegans]|nr:hypothetical protein BX666DRAFT_459897 [Dichotomocladium elegans]